MTSLMNRRWYHASWFTCLLLLIVTWALADFQFQRREFSMNISFGSCDSDFYYGWPFKRLNEHVWERIDPRPGIVDHGPMYTYKSHPLALGLNVLFMLLLVVSTFYICEHWWRSWRRFQFSVRSSLIFTAMVASGLTCVRFS